MSHPPPPDAVPHGLGFHAQHALRVVAGSRLNYRLSYLVDLACPVVLAGMGWKYAQSPWLALAWAATGAALFSFVEYAMHRWLFHAPSSFATAVHHTHHLSPLQPIAIPAPASAAAAVLFWPALAHVAGREIASCFLSGFLGGYFWYSLVHHLEHHVRLRHVPFQWMRRRWAAHAIHHGRGDRNFGVTTSFWDHVFGTCHR